MCSDFEIAMFLVKEIEINKICLFSIFIISFYKIKFKDEPVLIWLYHQQQFDNFVQRISLLCYSSLARVWYHSLTTNIYQSNRQWTNEETKVISRVKKQIETYRFLSTAFSFSSFSSFCWVSFRSMDVFFSASWTSRTFFFISDCQQAQISVL